MCYPIFLAFLLLTTLIASAETSPDFQSKVALFDYDAKQPLDIQDKVIEEFDERTRL